ncbi:MAG: hypothetical protein QF415_08195 [Candidatus Undinarchaeales archaeon]|jgi:hypothetical protein|nr:hypothetical protein [Candidatus Undinarchaeales archaeon]MDP7493522.1 hypothetical protein [Candidatus Undinarchaeales archaeon]
MEMDATIELLQSLAANNDVPDDAALAYGCFLTCHVLLDVATPALGTRIKRISNTADLGEIGTGVE